MSYTESQPVTTGATSDCIESQPVATNHNWGHTPLRRVTTSRSRNRPGQRRTLASPVKLSVLIGDGAWSLRRRLARQRLLLSA